MSDTNDEDQFVRAVRRHSERALKNRRITVWRGLGLMGTVGWMVSAPTVLGAFAGRWLDRHYQAGVFWTLSLIATGVALGCFGAWRTVKEELKL